MEITSNDLKRTSRHGTNGTSIKKKAALFQHLYHFLPSIQTFVLGSCDIFGMVYDGVLVKPLPAFEIIHQMAVSKPLSTGCVWGIPTDVTPFIGITRDNDDRCSQWIFQGPLFSLKPRWIPNMVYIKFHTHIGCCPKISLFFVSRSPSPQAFSGCLYQ